MEADDARMASPATGPEQTSPPIAQGQRVKRKRVRMACERCKTRKQKCDGAQPECCHCIKLGVKCVYKTHLYSKPQEVKKHVEALENRIAELETTLTVHGLSEAAVDHWRSNQRPLHEFSKPVRSEASSLAAVRDVSLNVSGPFIGDTSTLTLAKMLGSILSKRTEEVESQQDPFILSPGDTSSEAHDDPASAPLDYRSPIDDANGASIGATRNIMRGIQDNIANKLLQAYFNNVATNFPVVHSIQIKRLHENRDTLHDPYEVGIISLVYALGGQYLESTGQLAYHRWRYHYALALEQRDKVLQLGNTQTLAYLLLIIQQCLRIPRDPGGWTFIGIAMRICIELGLHRKKRRFVEPNLQSELEKRQFWACYYVDRDLAMSLGRPTSISDCDIDVELPLDIEEACEDPEVIKQAQRSDNPAYPSTSLTCFIHMVRLKRIESRIQHKIYRVDKLVRNLDRETDVLLESLAAWKNTIPPQSHSRDAQNLDTYMLYYYKCTRLLLQPQLYKPVINDRFLKLCTEACIGVCDTYRRLHDRVSVAFSTLSLQTIFVAGLTLLYCTWQAPPGGAMQSMSALSDCSIILYVMAERWPNVKRYRDAFEAIKRNVISLIANGKNIPGRNSDVVVGDAWNGMSNLDFDMMESITLDDLNQMLLGISAEESQNFNWSDLNSFFSNGAEAL